MKTAYCLLIQHIGLIFDFFYIQGLFTDAVVEHHNAETATKIGGIHDDIDGRRCGIIVLNDGFFKLSQDGFTTASVLLSELLCGLLACGVCLPKSLRVELVSAAKTLGTGMAFVTLTVVLPTVFFGVF